MFPVDARQEAALSDPVYMLRLYKRVAYGLVPRLELNGPRFCLHAFLSIDRRCVASRDVPEEPPAVMAAVLPIFPSAVLARQDVALLLRVLPLEEHHVRTADSAWEGGVRLGDVLLALRDMIPFQAWQVSGIVQAVRTTVSASTVMSPFEEHVSDLLDYEGSRRRQTSEAPPPPLTQREALFFLDRVCGLSSSQSHLLLRYVAREQNDAEDLEEEKEQDSADGSAEPPLDVRLLHQLLFSEEVPAVAEYPLLMGRFAESCRDIADGDPSRPTGSLALHSSLAAMELNYPAAVQATPLDLDFGSFIRAAISPRQFFYLCKAMQVGFEQRESDQLFYYLKEEHHSSEGVLVADLVAAFRQYFPPVRMSVLQLVQAAATRFVRCSASDGLAFVRLYAALKEWGTARVPIAAFVKAFRDAGVPEGTTGLLDIELEWLRLKAPTRVDVLLMLCSPVPPSRTAVILKLFERLDTAGEGYVQCATYQQRFQPGRVEGASVRRLVESWKTALTAYVDELGEPTLSYELFAYFWYMISAGVEDDPTFTVAIWQGFGLADDGRRQLRRR
ncbi:hypothetical protein NQL31_005393 [Lotmaria passim]